MESEELVRRIADLNANVLFLYRVLVVLVVVVVVQFFASALVYGRAAVLIRKANSILELAAMHGKVSDENLKDLKTTHVQSTQRVAALVQTVAAEIKATVPPLAAAEIVKKIPPSAGGDAIIPLV